MIEGLRDFGATLRLGHTPTSLPSTPTLGVVATAVRGDLRAALPPELQCPQDFFTILRGIMTINGHDFPSLAIARWQHHLEHILLPLQISYSSIDHQNEKIENEIRRGPQNVERFAAQQTEALI